MKLVCTIVIFFISSFSWARLQKPEEASHKYLQINQYYRVDMTAQYESVSEFEVEILNETGRREFGFYRFTYAPYLMKITSIEAYTRNQDRRYKVEKSSIEDKPVASAKDGFDNDNQVSVAFPNVQVGSVLYFKIKFETHTLSLENFFATIEYFGWRENTVNQNLYIESEKEIFYNLSDPLDALAVEAKNENKKYILNIYQKKPLFINPVEEREAYMTRRSVPHIEVSTEKKWTRENLKTMLDSYEKVVNSPLPERLESIYQEALKRTSDSDRLEYIIDQLQTHIRYLGDWRSIKGALVPRPLAEIANSGYGDCKDYSASLAAILRRLGYTSYVAWVYRGDNLKFEPTKLPSMRIHNHAITYAEIKGKSHWFDATNNMVYIEEPLPDIAGRDALILNPAGPKNGAIPESNYKKNRTLIQAEYSDIKKPYVKLKTQLKFSGVPASEWAGDQLRSSAEAIQFRLLEWTSSNVKAAKDAVFQPFTLMSRITRDLEFEYEFKELNPFYESNQGQVFLLWENSSLSQIADRLEQRSTDLGLNYPRISEYKISFKDVTGANLSKLNCNFKSEWVKFNRALSQQSKGIQIHDTITVLRPRIQNEEFNTPEMKRLLSDIRKCVMHKSLLLKQ